MPWRGNGSAIKARFPAPTRQLRYTSVTPVLRDPVLPSQALRTHGTKTVQNTHTYKIKISQSPRSEEPVSGKSLFAGTAHFRREGGETQILPGISC